MHLLLASSSPRRKELMALLGLPYSIVVPEDEEVLDLARSPAENAAANAQRKAQWVFSRQNPLDECIVVGVDTIVVQDNTVFEKPKNKTELVHMLSAYSGSAHTVISAMCVVGKEQRVQRLSHTRVFVKPLSEQEIQAYSNTAEWKDKAGGYAIQGAFAKFITRIEGSYFNVMGLDVSMLYDVLKEDFGALEAIDE